MNNNAAKYRSLCINAYTSCTLSAEDVADTLVKNLREKPEDHEQFFLPRPTAENIIRSNFVRKYDNQGRYMTTLAPVHRINPVTEHLTDILEDNAAKEPDFTYAATLTKGDLDVYAEIFNIKLNRSMKKENMLKDFKLQYKERV